MDRNGFIYFNTRLSPKNSGKADSYAWAIMILDEVLPYQDVNDLKENGNQPAEFNINLITAFKVDVKVSQSYTNNNGGKDGGDVPSLSPALSQVLSPDEEKDASTDAKDAISSSKVATLDEKVATSEEKVASPKKKISSEEMAIYILEYCSTWRSMDEIAQFANRDKNYIRNKVLPRLAEKLEKEYPDVPNHPRQRYRTIGRS